MRAVSATLYGLTVRGGAVSPSKAPGHLGHAGRHLWRAMTGAFDYGPGEVELLTALCQQQDRLVAARERVAADGPYVDGRFGLREHPALATERQALALMARVQRQLTPTPPTLRRLGGRSR